MATPSPVPSSLSPPLTVDTEINHNGVITVIASFSLFLVLGSLGIRVYSAYSRRVRQLDDLTFAATVAGYSADILYIAILSSSKASTALFYRTITLRSSLWMSYALLTVTLLCAPVAIVLLAVRCDRHPWHDISTQCSILFLHWQAVTALDITFEIILLLYPIRAITRLHTALNNKVIVILVLSCRVLLIPIGAIHLHYMSQQVNSADPTLEGTFATVVAELHVAFSVLVLTAPLMKPFVAAYVDENGLAYTDDASKSRTNHKLTPHSDRSNATYPGSRMTNSPAKNRIMKSIEISVDHEDVELLERR
ncbi:unnamed protein product [Penicillium nalgiovense]|uniref:Rhodopsin domain-containing protein n=1 Tax=Penicillium nalgiovense TaxID=60175 RepID=A0A9W4MR88_PENNA|nr:unnamed protein product [Penicillium nalgiovense]CAG8096092.1 unnamed protein product [Penicillium nalgiovense]CAG8097991.1 unnamed protein product [Penicillium nalgiovense]CAG8101721.1 unnamed protein product [Penicillium nalgiovense]CAG8106328.1 unnamed protein product [Penicillium nalgiovense]